jgi:tRNA-specific 2-thiouridylase
MKSSKDKKIVFVGMSGGVDSSVAAYLLKKRGHDVVGVFIRSYNMDGCAEQDAEDARRVAGHIGIPFYVWDFEDEYKKKVVEYMVEGYRSGLTPNPDVMCNKEIKFGLFLKKALAFGTDYVATGHYVRVGQSGEGLGLRGKRHRNSLVTNHYSLFTARDQGKDQSYFLWTLTQKQLRHCLFPIGDYLKSEVREIARKAGLPTAEKKDSQGICFLGKVSLSDFLKQYIPARSGTIITTRGRKIGEHEGAAFYTIGQRHGLNLGVRVKELGDKIRQKKDFQPLYVSAKDVRRNIVKVAEGEDHPALYKKNLVLRDVNLLPPKPYPLNPTPYPIFARVRYRQRLAPAKLVKKRNKISLIFNQPQKFVAPGQSAVFYLLSEVSAKEDMPCYQMLGGGIIV